MTHDPDAGSPTVGPVRFDHVVLGVRDLSGTAAALSAAGLRHAGGGEHTGRGTANALFPLAEGYLELLTVTDAQQARAHSPNRAQVADALDEHEVVPLGYALEVADVAAAAAALTAHGQPVTGPVDMTRRNPGGEVLTWRNLYVGPRQWQTVFPFLITWDTPNGLAATGEEARLAGLDLAAPAGADLGSTYRLLGATGPARRPELLAGVGLRWTRASPGTEGLTRIRLAGGTPRGPLPASVAGYLDWP